MSRNPLPPQRVEHALRLLPDVDAIAPLRAFVIAKSWTRRPSRPSDTVGKRFIEPSELRAMIPRAVGQVTAHLERLYELAVGAMEAEQGDDVAGAVRQLLEAGDLEAKVGRRREARAWYEQAVRIAERLRDRAPEIGSLLRLADLDRRYGQIEQAARRYQRALALAEAEQFASSAALACHGLGHCALEQGKWDGACSWFARARKMVDGDVQTQANIYVGEGEAELGRGAVDVAAEVLNRAQKLFAASQDAVGLARVLRARGRLYAVAGRRVEALATFMEALARLRDAGDQPHLEVLVRIDAARLHIDSERFPDAEDELRRAEQTAIVHNLTSDLVRLYVLLGELRGRQRDDEGFVFFEKAVELCRGAEPTPLLEAEAYRAYAHYREALLDPDEAHAYLERAREIFETSGALDAVADVNREIANLEHR